VAMTVTAGKKILVSLWNALIGYTAEKPLVVLVQQSAQSIPSATDTAVTFGASSETVDTHGMHDTGSNTSRITPTVAGWYRLVGVVPMAADTDVIDYRVSLAKNGTALPGRVRWPMPSTATASTSRSLATTALVTANGTTDYFEVMVQQVQAAAASLNTNVAATFSPTFECEFVRPL